jgi:hypothetical protein
MSASWAVMLFSKLPLDFSLFSISFYLSNFKICSVISFSRYI